jgi:hypothetical protein
VRDGLCNNCGARLVGPFCHHCGQKEIDDEWRSAAAIGRHLWDEIVSVDSKTVRTLAALLRPGFLSAEFVAGRRIRYLGPLKVYFLCAALFFLSAPVLAGFTFERMLAREPGGELRALAEARMAATRMPRELFAGRYDSNAKTVYTLTPILSVLVMTVLLRALYAKRCDRFGPHAVFAIHYVAFFYLAALGALYETVEPHPLIVLALTQGALAVYLFAAARRVYGESRARTAAKTAALIALAFAIDSPINIAARLLTVALT